MNKDFNYIADFFKRLINPDSEDIKIFILIAIIILVMVFYL